MTDAVPAVWFPAVRTGTGTDVFTERLVAGLHQRGIRAEITWLPLRAEYAPWTVAVPKPPEWATVIHVNTWLHPRFLPKRIPVVATVHHSIHDPELDPYKGLARKLYHRYWIRHIERHTMRRAHTVVAVSRFAADMARKMVLDRPIEVIYNGVDTNIFRPPAKREPHHPFRLLYVGSWMKRKGVDLLAPIMRELGDDFELRYTGGPAAAADQSTMPRNMRDIGRLHGDDAVVAAMQEVDALLFPSRSEGFGMVITEAMATGAPVIATNCSSIAELTEDFTTGILCKKESVPSFVKAVRALANDIPLQTKLTRASVNKVTKSYGIDLMVEKYYHQFACIISTSLL